jgi:hypothetical protein
MHNPYEGREPKAFWRSGVGELNPLAISGLWEPKFPIRPADAVSTAGSCFAQNIGRALTVRGFNWFDAEPAPSMLSEEDRRRFNYGVFSFRTANIYTTAMLRQWIEWAAGASMPPDEMWEEDGRWFDPFRPLIEPDGFGSAEELAASRATTLAAIRSALRKSTVFTFTLGLTEGWINRRHGHVYAACPGTQHGTFDAGEHAFHNFSQPEILRDLTAALDLARAVNPELRILLTVSPVPLTATASDDHVLVATTYSKAVLRSVAGEYVAGRDHADYFPSYEIIAAAPFRGMFYEPNLRAVSKPGVDFVMDHFFRAMSAKYPWDALAPKQAAAPAEDDEIICEEAILDEFNNA